MPATSTTSTRTSSCFSLREVHMVNGYVNVPKEFFDLHLEDMLNEIRLEPDDKLFNKLFEFVTAASHKVPILAGSFYFKEDEDSPTQKLSINAVGSYIGTGLAGVASVTFPDPFGGGIIIQADPSEIIIKDGN